MLRLDDSELDDQLAVWIRSVVLHDFLRFEINFFFEGTDGCWNNKFANLVLLIDEFLLSSNFTIVDKFTQT